MISDTFAISYILDISQCCILQVNKAVLSILKIKLSTSLTMFYHIAMEETFFLSKSNSFIEIN